MQLFDSLTNQKREFIPLEPGKVKMYSCGPTVYNYFHLGNARPFVVFDLLRRYLEYRGYKVTFVQNFTDIDDKMIRRANEEGVTLRELADKYIAEYFKDADGLGIKRATIQPRATESIDAIIEQVGKLVAGGHAYVSTDGVYFSTRSFPDYGKLSHFHLDELEAGASERVNTGENKHDPADFAVWKFKKPGEPAWPSPWGEGRPGWHIECSSMINRYLGPTIDIHSGGKDLIFPHHENEIAQSECATGKQLAHYWLHNGFINVNNEKMSKSLGNFFTVRDVVKHFPYDVIRFFLLTGHYRSPINFSDELLQAAQTGLTRLRNCYSAVQFKLKSKAESAESADKAAAAAESVRKSIDTARTAFIAAMDDDLNTPDALAAIFSWVREVNTLITSSPSAADFQAVLDFFDELGDVLGLRWQCEEAIPTEILALVEARTQAKKAKNFTLADELRKQITEAGYTLMDTPQGPRIEKQHA